MALVHWWWWWWYGQRLAFRPLSAGGVPVRTVGLGSTVEVLERPAFSRGGAKNASCGGCNGWALSVVFVGWRGGGGVARWRFPNDLADWLLCGWPLLYRVEKVVSHPRVYSVCIFECCTFKKFWTCSRGLVKPFQMRRQLKSGKYVSYRSVSSHLV